MGDVYSALVSDERDVPGALAYFIYKRSKAEWRANFSSSHQGNQPTELDEMEFVSICMLPENLESFKQRGANLARDFARKSLEAKMNEIVEQVAQSELMRQILGLERVVAAGFERIDRKLNEKKSLRAWGREMATALIAGLGIILIIGLLFNGYLHFVAINATAEKAVGIDIERQQKNPDLLKK